MNSVLLDITELLRKGIKEQNGDEEYLIKDIKTYYDIECKLRIAIKVFNKNDNKDEVIIVGGDYLGDLTSEDEQKWFEELN